MRAKIAKRIRRDLMRRGVVVEREKFIRVPGARRKDCGVVVEATYKGYHIASIADDWLRAYQMLRDDLPWCDECEEEDNGQTD